jgi:hypothetical protein
LNDRFANRTPKLRAAYYAALTKPMQSEMTAMARTPALT